MWDHDNSPPLLAWTTTTIQDPAEDIVYNILIGESARRYVTGAHISEPNPARSDEFAGLSWSRSLDPFGGCVAAWFSRVSWDDGDDDDTAASIVKLTLDNNDDDDGSVDWSRLVTTMTTAARTFGSRCEFLYNV